MLKFVEYMKFKEYSIYFNHFVTVSLSWINMFGPILGRLVAEAPLDTILLWSHSSNFYCIYFSAEQELFTYLPNDIYN